MHHHLRRGVAVALGIVGIGVLAVACAGSPGIGSASPPGRATIGGFTFQVPALPIRVPLPGTAQAPQQTTSQATLQGATHSGEGCPIALPQQ
jgi:hypothetical protein